ncbi:hypothetical protein PC9H_003420 [Pleurotus ostreatus]|uniref:Uncharacterized protein n=2 Tax=Pleurotus TaxID=5320 RepID=A0A8H7A0Y2_PLEOS|nr:uncharacterized protein PC9H_003420 [Pleurotus ostreatus]KAF7436587.1 hypothetical protein PC9H_003420 [Pleurotus ostreatus]KAG9222591.1 hypothetical protein CCMSSC00406_0004505 [Pleurotus cornucopiae]
MKLLLPSLFVVLFSVLFHTTSASPVASPNALALPQEMSLAERRSLGADAAMETLVTSVIQGLVGGVQLDNQKREAFTKEVVSEMRARFPQFNWIIVHVKHTTKFDGTRGVDWGHKHHELDIQIGGTIGYEIYNFKSGEFTRHGDGGFINWAFQGNLKSRSSDGRHLVFNAP